MNWTTGKPTQSGYYWYREPELETTVVRVLKFDEHEEPYVWFPGEEVDHRLSDCNGAWYGPLEQP
jgi:hypothetical protein